MRSTLWNVLLVLALSAPVFADDPSADARLRKAITLQQHTVLLSSALQEISRQTGVTFQLDESLQEQKVTLFVFEKPAWQVLHKLGSLLGIQCQKENDVYRLMPDPRLQQLERSQIEWERNALRRQVERLLQQWAQRATQDFTTIARRAEQMEEQMAKLEAEKPTGWQDRRARLAEQLAEIADVARLPIYLLARGYRQFPAEVRDRLWRGETLWFAYPPTPGTLPLPPQAPLWQAVRSGSAPEAMRLAVRLDVPKRELAFILLTDGVEPFVEKMPVVEEAQNPLLAYWQKWQTPLDALDRNPALQRDWKGGVEPSRPLFHHPTVADWLEVIARQGNLQVVADAFRLPSDIARISRRYNTLAEFLQEFMLRQPGYLLLEGEWLLFRHERYWQIRQSEPPEQLVQAMERKAAENVLSLDDYATFAAALSPEAQTRLQEGRYTVRFDLAPLQGALPALRFWASLTDAQKRTALQRQPLAYALLTPSQQRLFREALQAKSTYAPDALAFIADADAEPQLAFLLERWSLPAYTVAGENLSITAESPEESEQQSHLLPNAERLQQALSEQFTFYFGVDFQRSVRYELSILRKQETESR